MSAAPSQPLVTLRGITKRFGSFAANDRIDLEIGHGEIHALLGENGSGKSTLVKILYGLLRADQGEICWKGRAMRCDSPADARAHGIGMVSQHFSLFPTMSVADNIALGCDGARDGKALRERIAGIAADYGLAVDCDRMVGSLSAGERQRIEILRCLLQQPDLIILDEPTSVLTPAESDALFLTLRRLTQRGTSILFISHKLDEVREHCSRVTILRQGKVVALCDPRQETVQSLVRRMVGEDLRDIVPKPQRIGAAMLRLEAVATDAADAHAVPLRGLTFSVHAGEIFGIAGIAGNGQSELFACISGEGGPPQSGRITMGTAEVSRWSITQRRGRDAIFVPEERLGHAAIPNGTLSENLLLTWHAVDGIVRHGLIDWPRVRQATRDIVQAFNVRAATPDPEARLLSGGNLQKFVVGRDLARKPGLIVVNQPTWGIDAATATAVRQALLDCAAAGSAVLIISQDLDEILEIADRVAVISAGRLSAPLHKAQAGRDQIGLLMTATAQRPSEGQGPSQAQASFQEPAHAA